MTRRETPLDAAAILRVLAANEVDYVVKRAAGRPIDRGDVVALTEPSDRGA